MKIQMTHVNGIDVAYRWDGNKNGPIVMMAHAMGTSNEIWNQQIEALSDRYHICLLYTSPSPRDKRQSRMPSSA